MNPFGVGYNELHNLSSGKKVADDLALSILEVYENGKKMREEFVTSRINSNKGKFNDFLKRFNVKTFKTLTKYVVKCKHVQATVEIHYYVCVFLEPTFSFQLNAMLSGVRLTPSFPKCCI